LVILIFLIITSTFALAGSAYLTWNQNTEPDLAGYNLYYGTIPRSAACPNQTHSYTKIIDINKAKFYNVTNLSDGNTYYFSLTAYDTSRNEGCFSVEVSKSMPVVQPLPSNGSPAINASMKTLKTPVNTITIDGILSEKAWKNSSSIEFSNLSISDNQVKAYSVWDSTNIYFAFEVSDQSVDSINTTKDSSVWRDDGIEIFIDTLNNKNSVMQIDDYHFIINTNKAVWDAKGNNASANFGDSSWNSSIQVGLQKSQGKYILEVSLLWSEIQVNPLLGKNIGLLITNNDKDSGNSKYISWKGISPWNDPSLWGNLTLIHGADINKNGCMEISELDSFIQKWKSLNSDVSIKELMEAIGMWKKGC
jgi:hypothetical protein